MVLMIAIIVVSILVLAVFAGVIGLYNSLIQKRNELKNAWSQIGVQLKRRHDLIPNLVETVQGYAQHEKQTLNAVIEARQQAVNIQGADIEKISKAENQLSGTLKSLFALSESYPDLKANQNFLMLQEEISSTENRIAFSRQHYNDSAMELNNAVEMFPSNVIAGMFNIGKEKFFEIDEAEAAVPQVKF